MQKKKMKNDENGQLSCGIYSSPAAARSPLQGWVGDRCSDRLIVIKFLKRKIESDPQRPIPATHWFMCNNNYFQYEDSFYKQKFGISMGSPLSSVSANLFMEFFEGELLPTLPVQPPFGSGM